MNVNISQTEYEAICYAATQIEGDMESANDDFAHDASVHLNALYDLCEKYKKARKNDATLRLAKKIVRKNNPRLSESEVEKMARKVVRKSKENETE